MKNDILSPITYNLKITVRLKNSEQKRKLINEAKENGYENLIRSYIRYKLGLPKIKKIKGKSEYEKSMISFQFIDIEEKANTIAEAKKRGYKSLSSYVLSMLGPDFESGKN